MLIYNLLKVGYFMKKVADKLGKLKDLSLPSTKAVTKSRFVVKESYALSLAEHRLILSCIAQIDRTKPVPDTIVVTAKEFARDFPDQKGNEYSQLKTATENLFKRIIKLSEPDKKRRTWIRWIQDVTFADGDGQVELSFSKEIKPLLGNLRDNFVQFKMNEISNFKSAYSIRLFELLMQFKQTGFHVISIDDLKIAMAVDTVKSYKEYSGFKQKVLRIAIDEINEKSGWKVSVTESKKGVKSIF